MLVLAAIFLCQALDRGLPNILLEPIRKEFHLSDSQLGLFSGLGYAVAFSALVLPMGYVSDRVNRRTFLGVILLAWSLCTSLGGFARGYAHLVLARLGVGGAESGAASAILPMVSDIFPAERRGFAMGMVYIGNSLGTLVASLAGGLIAAEYGWRAAFFIAGVPGALLALLLFTTVREPARGGSDAGGATAAGAKPPRLRDVFAFLIRSPGLICLILGCAITGMVSISVGTWLASFFIRLHHLPLKQVGVIIGVAAGLGGALSPPLLSAIGDRLRTHDLRGPLILVAGALLGAAAGGWVLVTSPSVGLAVAMLILTNLLQTGYSPPSYAVLLNNVPPQLRGSAMSIIQLTTNIFGYGLGPVLVGVLSDLYGRETGLRWAIGNAYTMLLLAAVLLLAAAGLLYGVGPRPRAPRTALAP